MFLQGSAADDTGTAFIVVRRWWWHTTYLSDETNKPAGQEEFLFVVGQIQDHDCLKEGKHAEARADDGEEVYPQELGGKAEGRGRGSSAGR